MRRVHGPSVVPKALTYLVYEPTARRLPYLAVALDGNRAVDTFVCPDRDAAERILIQANL